MASIIKFIVKKQPFFLRKLIYKIIPFKYRYGKKYVSFLKKLNLYKSLNYDSAKLLQLNYLREILTYSKNNVPYYKNLFEKINFDTNIKSFDDLKKIPILTKDDVIKNFDSLISNSFKGKKYKMNTSGTTGKRMTILGSDELFKIECAFITNSFNDHGAKIYTDHSIWIRRYSPKKGDPLFMDDFELNRTYMSAFDLNDKTVENYVNFINKKKSKILVSYPSTLYYLSVLCKKHNLKLKYIEQIHGASEVCLPQWKDEIKKNLNLDIKMHYGQVEKVSFAHQDSSDDYYRENLLYGYNEFLEDGSLIATGFHNYVMPLIRYQTNDKFKLLENPVLDGAFPKTIESILGRNGDMLISESGAFVPAVNFYSFMSKYEEVDMFQILQKKIDKSVSFFIVPNILYNNIVQEKLMQEMIDRLGNISIEIIEVDSIKRDENSNKLKIVCQI